MLLTATQLENFRQQSDPLADALVQKIMASGSGRSINHLFDQLICNSDYAKLDLPPEISAYFKTTATLPPWADQQKIKIGQAVFEQFGPEICLLLMCKSLPEAYACKKGAQVMYQTGRMLESTDRDLSRFTRRLMETSQFVVNICSPNGFSPSGSGIITAQKVRLIHATIRYFIAQSGRWDAAENGLPINQEDLAGTLQSFSSLIIEGLGQLGVTLTPEQQDGYFHCWRIAGHLVGLESALNPENYQQGLALGYAILNHQKAASEAGVALTQAVHDFMVHIIPGNVFDSVPAILMRYFIGDKTADMLEIPLENELLTKIFPRVLKTAFKVEEGLENRFTFYKHLTGRFSSAMLHGMLHYFDDYKGVHFYLPPSLRENWKLDVNWEHYKKISPSLVGYRLAIEKKTSSL